MRETAGIDGQRRAMNVLMPDDVDLGHYSHSHLVVSSSPRITMSHPQLLFGSGEYAVVVQHQRGEVRSRTVHHCTRTLNGRLERIEQGGCAHALGMRSRIPHALVELRLLLLA